MEHLQNLRPVEASVISMCLMCSEKCIVIICICILERQRCALWIKKLCEPSGAGTGIAGRKNRNLYAKLLLHMLKRGVLEGPFTHKPEPGILKTLPSYMVGVTSLQDKLD